MFCFFFKQKTSYELRISYGSSDVCSSDLQEGKYVEELGGMNMYFVFRDGSIVTPQTGTILEGITRSSVIELAGKLGHQVSERKFSIDEWRNEIGKAAGRERVGKYVSTQGAPVSLKQKTDAKQQYTT